MLFLPILFLSLAFADDELQVETYCFSSDPARISVEKKLKSILVPSDKLEAEKSCFTVQMRPHRRELIQHYVKNLDPEMFITFSSADIKRELCQLQVEKVRMLKKNQTTVEVSQTPVASTGQQDGSSKDVMHVQTIDKFSLTVGQDAIEGGCRFITKDHYEITINARRDFKSLIPTNLPPNTIVVNQVPPPDQQPLNLTTTLQLHRGERTEIGSIVKNLRKKDQSVDIKPEAKVENTDQQEEESVFLSFF